MRHEVIWSAPAQEDLAELFVYVANQVSPLEAHRLCERLLASTDHLAQFPRLYEAAPAWGEGIRRISLAGRHVLYEVDDQAKIVRILALVGQRQDRRPARE